MTYCQRRKRKQKGRKGDRRTGENIRTWVVLHFYPHEGNKTRITLTHVGWKMGEEWQKALQYFNRAWEVVLGRFQYRFQKGPINWKKPFTPGAAK